MARRVIAVETAGDTWVTGKVVSREGLAAFTHLIRAPGDPERTDIRALPEHLRDRAAEWRRKLAKRKPEDFEQPILDLLADGLPRTWNAIGVQLLDKTADALFGLPPETALWRLVAQGQVEHTLKTPILFRLCTGTHERLGVVEQLDGLLAERARREPQMVRFRESVSTAAPAPRCSSCGCRGDCVLAPGQVCGLGFPPFEEQPVDDGLCSRCAGTTGIAEIDERLDRRTT